MCWHVWVCAPMWRPVNDFGGALSRVVLINSLHVPLRWGSLPELSVFWFYTSLLATGKAPASSWPTSQHSFVTKSSITVIGTHNHDQCFTWVTRIRTKDLVLAHQHSGSLSLLLYTALEHLYFTEK